MEGKVGKGVKAISLIKVGPALPPRQPREVAEHVFIGCGRQGV
jgi:hypothetical protein